ncbi:WD40-repeat-containing domain protein [Polychytrium aggregatum]|uniref:WD40-repeat-containing domain protein n=1 Tax=Polychytrium aggregatum TaxID=110093 RepID=UPI0022FE1361|nr:WD40-repeat-containing domain protein [Polychytrium aggregatum]KAI9202670.1 WD40-repeat-containing domain protein [Polychytrium aggregatum]
MSPTKDQYSFRADWSVFALHWSQRPGLLRLGLGSFLEKQSNKLQVIELDPESESFNIVTTADHQYPCSKLMWAPQTAQPGPELMATTSDYLRLWEYRGSDSGAPELTYRLTLSNSRKGSQRKDPAPLTSFDWNDTNPALCITSSIDTTLHPKTQLIAHDKDVFDVSFKSKSTDEFASVSADGSVRLFDLRALDHSTILYEALPLANGVSPSTSPGLVRISWNKQDPNFVATLQAGSDSVIILDIRMPGIPVVELRAHGAPVNSATWAPHSTTHLCTGGEDSTAFVWDISNSMKQKVIQNPILVYQTESKVNQVSWSTQHSEWVGVASGRRVDILKVA